MKPKGSGPKPFCFSDLRQERIYRRLLLVGPGPASFYRDACRIMSAEPLFDAATHLVAHLLREIESALRDLLESVVDRSERLSKNAVPGGKRHEAEIRAVLKGLGIPETDPLALAWLRLSGGDSYGLYARAHRDALARPRPVDSEFRKFWDEMQAIFDRVLERFESRYLAFHRLLDGLLAKPSPTRADAEVLRNRVPNNLVAFGYFFNRLTNATWLELLRAEGFFKHPPEPEREYDVGTVRFPLWPESRYLARMAALAPQRVLEIALEIPDTENVRVLEDLVDAALAMPAELAAKFLPKAKAWVECPYLSLLPEKLGALVAHLAQGGEVDEALDLAGVLLASDRTKFDTGQYEQILKKIVPELVMAASERALTLLCDLLDEAILHPGHRKEDIDPEDHSYTWRPAIEDHSQNVLTSLTDKVRDLLVSSVRDAAELLAARDTAVVRSLVLFLERRRWRIFHRMGLHLLRLFPDAAPELIVERLTDRERFDEPGLRHEYTLLARTRFPYLAPEDQAKILGWIEKGPDLEEFKADQERRTGKRPTDEEAQRYGKIWRRDRLALLGNALPEKWKQQYKQLVAEMGEAEHPEFVSYISEVWVGPTSPKTAEDLRSMRVEEVVSFLKEWQPSGQFMVPSPEGLGRELTTLVASESDRFAAEAERFKEVDPTYVRSLISGLREAARQERSFRWPPVLDLCHWVIGQARDIPGRKDERFELDPGWLWTRKAIADLLSVGFEKGAAEIPFNLRAAAWQVLRPLTDDPDPTPGDETRYGGLNMDSPDLSINTIRGQAMYAVVRYALWVRRYIGQGAGGEDRVARGFEEMPEVPEILERHLDPSHDRAPAIRVVYGQSFPQLVLLDSRWAAHSVTKIFPTEETSRDLRDAAWIAYMIFCRPYAEVFKMLHEEYGRAIDHIAAPTERRHLLDPDERLAEHLMPFYWRGELNLDEPGGLLTRFFAKASDALRGHAIEFVGRSLCDTKEAVAPQILDRLQALWVWRISAARGATPPASHSLELAAFGWWFASAKFDDAWAVKQLKEALKVAGRTEPDLLVVERLAKLAPEMPLPVVECLGMMVEGDKEGWRIHIWREDARTILATALQSMDNTARQAAVALINRLGARGLLDFQDLLSIDRARGDQTDRGISRSRRGSSGGCREG